MHQGKYDLAVRNRVYKLPVPGKQAAVDDDRWAIIHWIHVHTGQVGTKERMVDGDLKDYAVEAAFAARSWAFPASSMSNLSSILLYGHSSERAGAQGTAPTKIMGIPATGTAR